MSNTRLLPLLFVVVAALGCGDDSSGDDCLVDEQCSGALVCVDGLCVVDGCEPGSVGCMCDDGMRCGRDATGAQLACADGVCSSMTCPSGERGCACIDGETCNSEADLCSAGYCVAADCEPGADACPCLAGTCDVGLHCLDGSICVDDDGYEGGPCLESGRCNAGARCDATLDVCVYCDLGSEGCACDGLVCNGGLVCNAGLCVDSATVPPTDPVCYSPCRQDLVASDGAVRSCSSDGLLAGCVDDNECNEGSCVLPGEEPDSCADDNDCPFYQTCLSGQCYSNCESSLDCSPGLGCHKRVCRVPCESVVGADDCATGWFCDAEDGENGFCIPLSSATATTTDDEIGEGFELDHEQLAFSNTRTELPFDIVVDDPERRGHDFEVRKLWHEVTYRDGSNERVEAARDPRTGELGTCDAAAGECPLWWLDLSGTGVATTRDPSITVEGFGGCADTDDCPTIGVANAGGVDAVRWQGELEVVGNGGRDTIVLTYVEKPEGQWVGTMHYFGNFNDTGVDAWAARADKRNVSGVFNGLIQRWAAFRSGSLSGGWDEMEAVLTATRTESWTFGEVEDRCPAADGACYPYTNTSGVRRYVTDLEASPIPTGITELPLAMNLLVDGMGNLEGRIESNLTLHYPGNPFAEMTLSADPTEASSCDPTVTTNCVVWLDSFQAEAMVGGRYFPTDGTCQAGFVAVDEPWLVEGFDAATVGDGSGRLYRTVCLDAELPYDTSSNPLLEDVNRSLAGANPVPDGVPRVRTLSLMDGALIDGTDMIFLFRESFRSFVDADGSDVASSYGYVTLRRQATDLDDADEDMSGVADVYEGNAIPTVSRSNPGLPGASCSGDLIGDIIPGESDLGALTNAELQQLVDVLLDGSSQSAGSVSIPDSQMHYFCEETGLIDGGTNDDGTASATSIPCPAGSKVVYFSTTQRTQAEIAALPCQDTVSCREEIDEDDGTTSRFVCTGGSCQATVSLWRSSVIDEYEPAYTCDAAVAYCDDNRLDLRDGKTFYVTTTSTRRDFNGLQADIEAAFRYRTRFTSSSGSRPGFAPEICIPDSNQIPYCYDPTTIEEIRDRIDCLLAINAAPSLRTAVGSVRNTEVEAFLKGDFAQFDDDHPGFERLYSELLVMMGDEALTRAFASRFDLAAVGGASFEGSLLEPGGIDLSGVAGFEMAKLYEAVQRYQLALDRLYALGPNFTGTLDRATSVDSAQVFLSAESVVLYIDRLVRASTQKARAYSEIAKRYQNFNQPELARSVIERGYAASHIEGAVIANLIGTIADRSVNEDQAQIELTLSQAQRRYRMALLDMRNLYASITDELDYFGFSPDYIPFPALDASARGRNAFEVMLGIARSKLDFARTRELEALMSDRSFQTGTASFQAELVRIRQTYENQLVDLCGTFVSPDDGEVYPAIERYAGKHPAAQRMGDPCGRMGNGQIHQAYVTWQQQLIAEQLTRTRIENLFSEVEIERQRVSDQCDEIFELADYQYSQAGDIRDLNTLIGDIRNGTQLANAQVTNLAEAAAGFTCVPGVVLGECISDIKNTTIRTIAATAVSALNFTSQEKIIAKEARIANIERNTARWVTENECDAALIDSNARTETILLQLEELDLEQLKGSYQTRLAMSEIERLYDRAVRLQTEQEEAFELLVDVEAARTDPNVRIYRNDAIINADIAFEDALAAIYKATRVFEYYTSQSYEAKEQLFLIRMVTAGDYNLENYVLALENAFYDFEETYGAADLRVMQLSLMDDILQIPLLDDDSQPIPDEDRYAMLRERVQDVDLLDENGYITMNFATQLERLSPLTRNHKIVHVEAEMAVTTADHVGRLYLRPVGTGIVRSLGDTTDYYVFPQRTAVINPFFNGNRVFTPEVYQNTRLRDRPLVNTNWELVFNQRDEVENKDISLDTLTDVRLYVYYTDFTAL